MFGKVLVIKVQDKKGKSIKNIAGQLGAKR